ncbi:hypothetical protein GQR36_26645 [Enterococcus termitis]
MAILDWFFIVSIAVIILLVLFFLVNGVVFIRFNSQLRTLKKKSIKNKKRENNGCVGVKI